MTSTEKTIAEYRELLKQARLNQKAAIQLGDEEDAADWAATARDHERTIERIIEAREEHEAFRARHHRRIAEGAYRPR